MNNIYAQFRKPTGVLGWLAGHAMALKNADRSEWVLQQLAPQPGEQVLEIGFGSGTDIARLVEAVAPAGMVTGIDASEVMVRMAQRRNRRAIAEGRADLRFGNVEALPFADAEFDAVYSVNCAMFWPDLNPAFAELHRVTRLGGRAVIAVQPMHRGASAADSEEWLGKLDRAAQAGAWTVGAREIGPLHAPIAAVVLRKQIH
ncbi:class I SAM-dependent methyltransferase [Haliangium sp.]|uniref:class I SAM-dependent methyltransferase n=1 Tax=Haliangium sp. TaxID=2663208 RepID=UPI003D0F80DF